MDHYNAAEDFGFDAGHDDFVEELPVDDGFVEDLDGAQNLEHGEMSLAPGEYYAYRQELESRRITYLIMKDDFLFNVKMAFHSVDAFDWGLIRYSDFRLSLIQRVLYLEKYRADYNVPFRSFVAIVQALIGDVPWNENLHNMYASFYLIVFPE